METKAPDVNTDIDSSKVSSETEQGSQTQDVSTESSTVTKDVNKEPTLKEVVDKVLEKHQKKEESSTEEKGKESAVLKENDTNKKEESKEGEKKDETVVQPNELEDKKFSPTANERIRKLANEKTEYEKKVKEYEPVVQRMQNVESYCQRNNISADDYQQALELSALVKSNPQEAVKKLSSIVDNIKQATGESLPPDLQTRVNEGTLSVEDGKEMAMLRLQVNGNKQSQQRQQVEIQQRTQKELTNSLNSWSEVKKTSDPDFKPKVDGSVDGKYELVFQKFLHYWNTQPINTVQEAVGLLDKAYSEIDRSIKQFIPAPPKRQSLRSNGSSTKQKEETIDVSKPGWARQVGRQVLSAQR